MTLIIGINLSDRLYLAADTLVTNIDTGGKRSKGIDNQLKIEEVSSHVAVACSGNGKMGAYVVKELKKKVGKMGIRELQEKIGDLLEPIVKEYFLTGATTKNSRVVLTFAGMDFTKQKQINGEAYFKYVKRFGELKKEKFDKDFKGRPLEDLNPEELLKLRSHMEDSQVGMKDVILQGIKNGKKENGNVNLPIPDSHIFQFIIDPLGPDNLEIKNFNYGEWAVSGVVVHKEIPEELMIDLDFNLKKGKLDEDTLNIAVTIVDKFSENVGGCVSIFMVNHEGIFLTTQTLTKRAKGSKTIERVYGTTVSNGKYFKVTKNGLLIEFKKLTEGTGENCDL